MSKENKNFEELISYAEDRFDCYVGMPYSFMEFPQKNGGDMLRVIYVTYITTGGTFLEAEANMKDVLDDLVRESRECSGRVPLLYWRLPEKFEFAIKDGRRILRTRIAVLETKHLDSVESKLARNPQG